MLLEHQVWMISIVAIFIRRDKTTPTSTTPLILANMSCAVDTFFSSHAFLSSSVSMLHGQPEPFGSCIILSLALLSSFVSTANMSCLLVATFFHLRFLSNSLSSPRFNLLRVARRCFLFFFSRLIQNWLWACACLGHVIQPTHILAYVLFVWVSHRQTYTHIYITRNLDWTPQCGARFACPINVFTLVWQ